MAILTKSTAARCRCSFRHSANAIQRLRRFQQSNQRNLWITALAVVVPIGLVAVSQYFPAPRCALLDHIPCQQQDCPAAPKSQLVLSYNQTVYSERSNHPDAWTSDLTVSPGCLHQAAPLLKELQHAPSRQTTHRAWSTSDAIALRPVRFVAA